MPPPPALAPGERSGVELLDRVVDRSGPNGYKGNAPEEEEDPLTLSDLLTIALIPSMVPAGVLMVALAIAVGLGELPPVLRSCFEQIAGGALLITYLKEIFPRVMERLDEAVEALGPTTAATRRAKHRRWFGLVLLVVMTTVLSVVVQAWAEQWPGLRIVTPKAGRSNDAAPAGSFTPGDTLPYFLGFFVDGVVLAYDDNRIECNNRLVKKLVLSCVLAIDNFLDGFGLAPVLRSAFHEAWWVVMVLFACCVLLGAASTATLRWLVDASSVVHTVWFAFSTLSILDGAMELCQAGLTLYVVAGMAVTWLFLFIGDAADDEEVDVDDGSSAPTLRPTASERA